LAEDAGANQFICHVITSILFYPFILSMEEYHRAARKSNRFFQKVKNSTFETFFSKFI